jgi:anaerobic magnesium-protoporphyrin IX monomethyl ester cyclase
MKITLIFPGITFTGWNSFGKSKDFEANFVHHGLASISSYLKFHGHDVNLIDLRKLNGWEHFKQVINDDKAEIFGISSMSCDYENSKTAARIIKRVKPYSVVVIGGVHSTMCTKEVSMDTCFDYIIIGEGEYSFNNLINSLDGIYSENDYYKIRNRELVDINNIPWIDRQSFDCENGENNNSLIPHFQTPFVTITTSRGCIYNCRYCQYAEREIFGKVKIRPVFDVIKELQYLKFKYKFSSFWIHDDLFAINGDYVSNFVKLFKYNIYPSQFGCQIRADIICEHEDRIKKLADIGLDCVSIGFESGSQRVLDFINKGTTVEQNRKAVEICRKYGIKVYANIMFGLPTETKTDMDKTVKFVRWAKPDYLSMATFTPYPGSYLYDYCKKEGLLIELTGDEYRRNPMTGKKIKGVNYNTVNYSVFKCDPKAFIYSLGKKWGIL